MYDPSANEAEKANAAEAIGNFRDTAAWEFLARAAGDARLPEYVRGVCVYGLSWSPRAADARRVLGWWLWPFWSHHVRYMMSGYLDGWVVQPGVRRILTRQLRDPTCRFRSIVASLLGRGGDPALEGDLLDALKVGKPDFDSNSDSDLASMWASSLFGLARVGGPLALETLWRLELSTSDFGDKFGVLMEIVDTVAAIQRRTGHRLLRDGTIERR